MSDWEINKLKKELQRVQERVKEEKDDHHNTHQRLVHIQAVRFESFRKEIGSTHNL